MISYQRIGDQGGRLVINDRSIEWIGWPESFSFDRDGYDDVVELHRCVVVARGGKVEDILAEAGFKRCNNWPWIMVKDRIRFARLAKGIIEL